METYIPIVLYPLIILSIIAYDSWLKPWRESIRRRRILPSTLQTLMERAGGEIQPLGEDRFEYKYQDGIFLLRQDQPHTFTITFPAFFSIDRDSLEAVRNLANRANQTYDGWSFFYFYNERTNEMVVSLSTRFVLSEGGNADEAFRITLRNCFELRHMFVTTFQKEEEEESDERAANDSRDRFLLNMREYALQGKEKQEPEDARRIGTLLKFFGEDEVQSPVRLTIYGTGEPTVITDKDEILNYDLATPILAQERQTLEVNGRAYIDQNITLALAFVAFKKQREEHLRQITICLEVVNIDQDVLFFRATYSRAASLPESEEAMLNQLKGEQIHSTMLAYDFGRLEAREAEFRYMWGDAQDKMNEGKYSELTEAQRLLVRVDEQPIAYNLYWARKYSLTNRYAEAVVLFKKAYLELESRFEQLSDNEKETFAEVLYHLSFCYANLHNPEMAFFYISGLQGTRNWRYQKEIVNTLVNMGDYRALQYIDRFLRRLDETNNTNDEEEDNLPLEEHRSFLYRRRLTALTNASLWKDAEQFAVRLSSRPDCRQFAQEKLDYIRWELERELREQAQEATQRLAKELEASPFPLPNDDDKQE